MKLVGKLSKWGCERKDGATDWGGFGGGGGVNAEW